MSFVLTTENQGIKIAGFFYFIRRYSVLGNMAYIILIPFVRVNSQNSSPLSSTSIPVYTKDVKRKFANSFNLAESNLSSPARPASAYASARFASEARRARSRRNSKNEGGPASSSPVAIVDVLMICAVWYSSRFLWKYFQSKKWKKLEDKKKKFVDFKKEFTTKEALATELRRIQNMFPVEFGGLYEEIMEGDREVFKFQIEGFGRKNSYLHKDSFQPRRFHTHRTTIFDRWMSKIFSRESVSFVFGQDDIYGFAFCSGKEIVLINYKKAIFMTKLWEGFDDAPLHLRSIDIEKFKHSLYYLVGAAIYYYSKEMERALKQWYRHNSACAVCDLVDVKIEEFIFNDQGAVIGYCVTYPTLRQSSSSPVRPASSPLAPRTKMNGAWDFVVARFARVSSPRGSFHSLGTSELLRNSSLVENLSKVALRQLLGMKAAQDTLQITKNVLNQHLLLLRNEFRKIRKFLYLPENPVQKQLLKNTRPRIDYRQRQEYKGGDGVGARHILRDMSLFSNPLFFMLSPR